MEIEELEPLEQFVVNAGKDTVARWRGEAKRRFPDDVAKLDAKAAEMVGRVANAIRDEGRVTHPAPEQSQ